MAIKKVMIEGNGFTSVEEGLPKPNSRVIAYTNFGEMIYDMMYKPSEHPDSEWMTRSTRWRGIVVAWREMLEPPMFEEVEEE